ncbi:hypothetical protein BC2230_20452 [Burkholderia cepacia]
MAVSAGGDPARRAASHCRCTLRKNRDGHVFQRSGARRIETSAVPPGTVGTPPGRVRVSPFAWADGHGQAENRSPCAGLSRTGRHCRADRKRPSRVLAPRARREITFLDRSPHGRLRIERSECRGDSRKPPVAADHFSARIARAAGDKKSPYREDTGVPDTFAVATLCSWQRCDSPHAAQFPAAGIFFGEF